MKKIVFIVLLSLVLIAGGLLYFSLNKIDSISKNEAVKLIERIIQDQYKAEIDTLHIDLLNNNLAIHSIKLKSKITDETKVKIDSVIVKAKSIKKIIRNKDIELKSCKVYGIEINTKIGEGLFVKDSSSTNTKIKELVVDTLLFVDCKINIDSSTYVRGLNLNVLNFKLLDTNPKFKIEDATVSIDSSAWQIDKFNKLTIGKIFYNHNDSLSIKSLKYYSDIQKDKYCEQTRHSYTKLFVESLSIDSIDVERFINTRYIYVSKVNVVGANIYNYKNKHKNLLYPFKPLFHTVIQKLPFGIDIPQINIFNSRAEYEELSEKASKPGKVYFTNIEGKVTGLTNDSTRTEKYYTIHAHTFVYGHGKLTADFKIPIHSDVFSVSATLGKMDLKHLNTILLPTASVNIKSGIAEEMRLSISADSYVSKIKMKFLYKDLKIDFIKRDKNKKSKFVSLFANVIIHHSNPANKHKSIREVESTIQRNTHRAPFQYLWKSVEEGLMKTILP